MPGINGRLLPHNKEARRLSTAGWLIIIRPCNRSLRPERLCLPDSTGSAMRAYCYSCCRQPRSYPYCRNYCEIIRFTGLPLLGRGAGSGRSMCSGPRSSCKALWDVLFHRHRSVIKPLQTVCPAARITPLYRTSFMAISALTTVRMTPLASEDFQKSPARCWVLGHITQT